MINLKELIVKQLKKAGIDTDILEFKDIEYSKEKIILMTDTMVTAEFKITKPYLQQYFKDIVKCLEEGIDFKYGRFIYHGGIDLKRKGIDKELTHADCKIYYYVYIDAEKVLNDRELDKLTKPEKKEEIVINIVEPDISLKEEDTGFFKSKTKKNKKNKVED